MSISPNNAILVLAGDVPSHTEEGTEQYFGRLCPGPDVAEPEVPPIEPSKTVPNEIGGSAGTGSVGLLVWPLQEDDEAVAIVANAVLQNGRPPAGGHSPHAPRGPLVSLALVLLGLG